VGPAIVAVVCSSLAYDYFFTPPLYSFAASPEDLPDYALFVLFAFLVGWFGVVRRRAEAELRQSRDALEVEVEQRQALNVELEKRSQELQATNKELG
jgi:two-component system sensor histidine kinase KdpD